MDLSSTLPLNNATVYRMSNNTAVLVWSKWPNSVGNLSIMDSPRTAYAWSRHLERFNVCLGYIIIALAVGTLLTNAVVLAAFIKHSTLRTSFNTYLISLILAVLGQALFDLPFLVMSQFVPVWPLGHISCNFYMYSKWIFSAAVRNTHAMISLNRIWALFWPLSYRHAHTKITAIWLCAGTWIYVHVWLCPGLLLDDLYYRMDEDRCEVNTAALHDWALPTQIVVHDFAVLIVGLTYPVIRWKIRQRKTLNNYSGTSAREDPMAMKAILVPINNVDGRKLQRTEQNDDGRKACLLFLYQADN